MVSQRFDDSASDSPQFANATRSGYDKGGSETTPSNPPPSSKARMDNETMEAASKSSLQQMSMGSLAHTSASFSVGMTLLVIVGVLLYPFALN